MGFGTPDDLVHFVEKNDAILLDPIQRSQFDVLVIDETACLFLGEQFQRLLYR